MGAVVFSGPGGNEVIDLVERPDPVQVSTWYSTILPGKLAKVLPDFEG